MFSYRAEVDGLRGIAILLVLAFHANLVFSGGYIGVDVFFVISGFLITSLIWKDIEDRSFTFAYFWERRARRIIPALVVVALATLLAGWFLLLPTDFKSLGRAASSQSLFAANIHYWRDSGYFDGVAEEKPLLHTWSLAVEEQFYLFFPFALWMVFRFAKSRKQKYAVSLLITCLTISLATSVYGVHRSPTATFYLLPTRAWELLCGSLVAFFPVSAWLLHHRFARNFLAFAGLALILIPAIFYKRDILFPGLAALPPCLGTALLIWSNGRREGNAPTFIGTLLCARPLVFVGLISYSLYLWHWPFLAFSRYLALSPLAVSYRVAMLFLGFLCALLSWKYVETPFRKRQIGASQKSIFSYTAAGLFAVSGFGLVCMKMQGFPQRFSPRAQEYANAKSEMSFRNEVTEADVRAEKLISIGVKDPKLAPTVFVWGDSHAMAALSAIDLYLKEKGLAGRAATHSSTAPVLGWFRTSKWGLGKEAPTYNQAVFAYIQQHKIPHAILSCRWISQVESDKNTSKSFESALITTVQRLAASGCRPWILLDVPHHTFDIPKALSSPIYSLAYVNSLRSRPAKYDELEKNDPNLLAKLKTVGGRVLDPKPLFLDPIAQQYIIQRNGVSLYYDHHHLTTRGSQIMLMPLLHRSFLK